MKEYFRTLWTDPAAARKAIVAIIGAVVMLASQGVLPDPVSVWVTTITPVLTALGVYAVHNEKVKQVVRPQRKRQ